MALSVTSAPFQQVSMPALDLRRYLGAGLQEGVASATDMAVAQRGAGANFSVDIAAGEALIQGDTVANQGRYYVLNDAVFNLTGFTTANATNPRIDRVTLRVRDAFHGDAANDVSFQIVTGTATAGATLANLNGAAAVPNSQLLLANILIPATATTVTTANIDTTVRRLIGNLNSLGTGTPSATTALFGDGTWKAAGSLLGVQVLTGSGTYTPTAGTGKIWVECVGGGGAGGGTPTAAATGSGGGAGAYAASLLTSGFSGASYVVGAGGTGVSNASGGAGSDTTWATTVIVAKGGSGGTVGVSGANTGPTAGGLASASTGQIKFDGQSGQGTTVAGGSRAGGDGGSSPRGGAGGRAPLPNNNGNAGSVPGGGGSGGLDSTAANRTGGNGAAGTIIVYEYA